MHTPCPVCRCHADSPAHAIAGALAVDDLDRALALGLLEAGACHRCSDDCRIRLAHAREARLAALAARDRYRARQARLARREAERTARRAGRVASTVDAGTDAQASGASILPPAAEAALARALARASGKPH